MRKLKRIGERMIDDSVACRVERGLFSGEVNSSTDLLSRGGECQKLSAFLLSNDYEVINMMTLNDACTVLRVNPGDNDDLINSLIDAIPDYIEVTTGMCYGDQETEPLVDTVSGFLLKLWYFGDHADDVALTRTIDALLKAITIKARNVETQ